MELWQQPPSLTMFFHLQALQAYAMKPTTEPPTWEKFLPRGELVGVVHCHTVEDTGPNSYSLCKGTNHAQNNVLSKISAVTYCLVF